MAKKKITKKNKAGVSLIEMTITISIIGILAAAAVVSVTSTKNAARTEAAQKELASEISLMKAYALQGRTQSISGSTKTPCGYGVYILNETQYFSYYNYGTDCKTFNTAAANLHYGASSTKIDEKSFSGGVKATGSVGIDAYFTVPNAATFNSSGNEISSGTIDFTLTSDSVSKKVSVGSSGFITISK